MSAHTHHFFAFDLGATSGRSILATLSDNKLELKELTRFPNKIIRVHDKYHWDILALFDELKNGLKAAAALNIRIDAIGIDTWGVDFVYLGKDGTLLSQPRSYRDPYTNGMPEEYFKIISKKEVYDLTGIQIMNFNSLFQLFAAKREGFAALDSAKDLLFMPDALSYMLTGKKVCEYTIASTSQLLNPRSKNFEAKLFEAMGVDPSIMQPVVMPGEMVDYVLDSVAKECGTGKIPVIAVAGHDTGSAVAAVPADNENFAYLSSGTWSLMGIEAKNPIINVDSYEMNFTNEGGVDGTTRFLKNITGMWLLEQCRKEWEAEGRTYTYPEIVAMSNSVEGFQSMIDPDDASFANPESMTTVIACYCQKTKQEVPVSDAEYIRCIFDSLALKYRYVLECLQKMAPFCIERLHVIGGGSQNRLLNQATANSTGIPVVAGPSEATAIGNVMMQAKGVGLVNSLHEMRAVIKNSVTPEVFMPEDTDLWDKAYQKFLGYISSSNLP
ncbi:MAG: rhamnulokinase family protein [Dysgonomonas sp.]|nr:rhamnulokinase family protein [Dysgonomonas sp.]